MDSTRAAVFEGQDTLPYHVGAFRFAEDCGLYVLAGLESDDAAWLRTLMRALGLSGIGGKVSSGYGKFTVDDEIYLNEPSMSRLRGCSGRFAGMPPPICCLPRRFLMRRSWSAP